MKKIMTLMVMLMFVLSIAPALGDELTDARTARCMENIPDNVRSPEAVCDNVVKNIDRCARLLQERGVEHPLRVCEAIKATTVQRARDEIRMPPRIQCIRSGRGVVACTPEVDRLFTRSERIKVEISRGHDDVEFFSGQKRRRQVDREITAHVGHCRDAPEDNGDAF